LHAAGMEMSHFLPAKPPAEFGLVFDVKSDGWFHLLHAIGELPIKATVVFCSIASRFGNAGQTDYASANDLLCKITSSLRHTRPHTRGLAIDWTAWRDIGMASRGSIPKMMAAAGVDMLPPDAGVTIVRRELTRAPEPGEVLIALGLGMLLRADDPVSGFDRNELVLENRLGPMVGMVTGMTDGVLTVETTLDPRQQPFLRDHQIEGTPVLPGVMGIEAFAEAASLVLPPGWSVASVEDVTFASAFKFYRNEPRRLRVEARFSVEGGDLVASCRLIGSRTRPGQALPHETVHFTGRVRMVPGSVELGVSEVPDRPDATIASSDIYRVYFHGPAYQVLAKWWQSDQGGAAEVTTALPANHDPANRPTLMLPRLIESCFQTAGLWEIAGSGRMALPHRIERVSTVQLAETPVAPLYAVNRLGAAPGTFDMAVVDSIGRVFVLLRGYRTAVVPDLLDRKLVEAALGRFEVSVAK
jgi:hypothetical protein